MIFLYLEVVAKGKRDPPGDLIGERQPVLGVDKVYEVPCDPHVLGVAQGGRDGRCSVNRSGH